MISSIGEVSTKYSAELFIPPCRLVANLRPRVVGLWHIYLAVYNLFLVCQKFLLGNKNQMSKTYSYEYDQYVVAEYVSYTCHHRGVYARFTREPHLGPPQRWEPYGCAPSTATYPHHPAPGWSAPMHQSPTPNRQESSPCEPGYLSHISFGELRLL